MVFEESHELSRHQVQSRGPTSFLLPLVTLSLVKVSPFYRRKQFLRTALKIGVVGFIMARQGHEGAVMQVVVPQGIEAKTTAVEGSGQPGFLSLIFGNKQSLP